jgi:acid phosphatase (class A)
MRESAMSQNRGNVVCLFWRRDLRQEPNEGPTTPNRKFFFAHRGLPSAFAIALSTGAAIAGEVPATPEIRPGVAAGYLAPADLPDSVALLPPPPAEGSAALAMDQEINRKELALQGGPRWRQAGLDANLAFPWAAGDFACALNAPINVVDTPRLYGLLRRTATDAGAASRAAKDRYQRPRPFMINKAPTCTPGAEGRLAQDGAYPSGHTTIGWTWALILAEIAPDRSQQILSRGRSFGQSRVVCNVHWQSDVIEASFLAAANVARLHADPAFLADLEAAKGEIAALRGKTAKPQRDCKAEAEALAADPPPAP